MEVIKNEFISKLEVVRILQKAYAEGRIKAEDGCVSVLDDINAMPSADVQPVRHGRWEEIEEYGGWGDTYFRCSICGDEWDLDAGTPVENGMKYCPNCGARLIGGEKEQ